MTRGFDLPPSLSVLSSATNLQDRLAALKQLKNDIIGHERRKEIIIYNGVAKLLAACLVNDASSELVDQVRLQAIHVVTSLSNAGNPYIAPLVNARVVTALCCIFEETTNTAKLRLEALRALTIIVKNLADDPFEYYASMRNHVYTLLISPLSISIFAGILDKHSNSPQDNEFLSLILQIIRYTAEGDENRQRSFVQASVLDILASKLAAWIINYQEAFRKDYPYFVLQRLSSPPPKDCLPALLLAIASIVKDSHYRSLRLLFSQDIVTTFPTAASLLGTDSEDPMLLNIGTSQVSSISHPWERLLPQLTALPSPASSQNHGYKTVHFGKSFPPLSSYTQTPPRVPFVSTGTNWSRNPNEPSSHLLAWLVYMSRSTQGDERRAVLWLLSVLVKATELSVGFGKPLALLVVPIILRLIAEEPSTSMANNATGIPSELILAEFINSNNSEQSAAFEGEAVKPLTSRLRKAFDVMRDEPTAMWSPEAATEEPPRSLSDASLLGPPMPTESIANFLRYRAHAMKALAAITEKDNVNKTDTIKTGIMSSILEALNPYPINPDATDPVFKFTKRIEDIDPKHGNPTYVIKAALGLLLGLSRSIHVLRTSLIDNHVAKPVLQLVQHEDMEVTLAATDALTNLVLHFSPMKEELISEGIIGILCSYTHSTNTELRISALWALKHLVLNSSEDVRNQVFDELGAGYLSQLLMSDTPHKSHLASANALGEKVDLLNDDDPPFMDVDQNTPSDDETDSSFVQTDSTNQYGPAKDFVGPLQAFKRANENHVAQARKDSIRIQHHALNLVANLITIEGPTSSETIPRIINKIISSMGQNRFFDIILSKLRPSNPSSSSSKRRFHDFQKNIDSSSYAHVDIITGAIVVLVHIANGDALQRQMLISTPHLLETVSAQFAHPEEGVRVKCCWLVHNLLWVDSNGDQTSARERARELKNAGVIDLLKTALDDEVLDVKERAKAGLEAYERLTGEGNGASSSSSRQWGERLG